MKPYEYSRTRDNQKKWYSRGLLSKETRKTLLEEARTLVLYQDKLSPTPSSLQLLPNPSRIIFFLLVLLPRLLHLLRHLNPKILIGRTETLSILTLVHHPLAPCLHLRNLSIQLDLTEGWQCSTPR